MNIDDFFNLPEETRDHLLSLHRKRKQIRMTREGIDAELQQLRTRELNLQLECLHPVATERYVANENEFGNLTGGGTTHYYCPDCHNRWTEDK